MASGKRVLVTGGAGNIGSRMVAIPPDEGCPKAPESPYAKTNRTAADSQTDGRQP